MERGVPVSGIKNLTVLKSRPEDTGGPAVPGE